MSWGGRPLPPRAPVGASGGERDGPWPGRATCVIGTGVTPWAPHRRRDGWSRLTACRTQTRSLLPHPNATRLTSPRPGPRDAPVGPDVHVHRRLRRLDRRRELEQLRKIPPGPPCFHPLSTDHTAILPAGATVTLDETRYIGALRVEGNATLQGTGYVGTDILEISPGRQFAIDAEVGADVVTADATTEIGGAGRLRLTDGLTTSTALSVNTVECYNAPARRATLPAPPSRRRRCG